MQRTNKKRAPTGEQTNAKLRAAAKARHEAKLLDPTYKPKVKPAKLKRTKKRKPCLSNDVHDLSNLGDLWKEPKKVKVKRAKKGMLIYPVMFMTFKTWVTYGRNKRK